MNKAGNAQNPTHPGEIIKEEIERKNLTQRLVAKWTGMPFPVLNEIVKGKRPLTEKTALVFNAALGISAERLMSLQTKYNLHKLRNDAKFREKLEAVSEQRRNLH